MHRAIMTSAAALPMWAGGCLAQPPGITREMIERALPVEGAPLVEPGPYKAPVMVWGTVPQEGAPRRQETADDVRTAIAWAGGAPPSPQPTSAALPELHGPALLINGHEPAFMMATPAFYRARHNAGHTATVFHHRGGEFANVASNRDVRSKGIKE